MQRVLDTAALLHWPMNQLAGGICAESQRRELSQLSEARSMLIDAADLQWQDAPQDWIERAKQAASQSGDLPRLSDVDVDVLALALGHQAHLVTDDYRLQNAYRSAGGEVSGVANTTSKAVWSWSLHCTGCRAEFPVPEHVERSKNKDVGSCERCGSPLKVKRKRG
jgi:rRNA maturation endonuclease Nob1